MKKNIKNSRISPINILLLIIFILFFYIFLTKLSVTNNLEKNFLTNESDELLILKNEVLNKIYSAPESGLSAEEKIKIFNLLGTEEYKKIIFTEEEKLLILKTVHGK